MGSRAVRLKRGIRAFPKPRLEEALRAFFKELGVPEGEWEDRKIDLHSTPQRVARMYEELLASYAPGAVNELIKRFTCFPTNGDHGLVVIGPIRFFSLCSHHLLPFSGEAFVGYIPDGYLIGASKIPRVVEFYSRMLQIQERMGQQVAQFVLDHSRAKAVLVTIRADHYCMKMRGAKSDAKLVSTVLRPLSVLEGHYDLVAEFHRHVQLLTDS